MNFVKKCIVKPGTKIDLEKIDPNEKFDWTKHKALKQIEKNLVRIAELQDVLFAEQKHSMIYYLQAMDTGGKDGTVRVVGGAMNPAGTNVASFKKPTEEEMAHVKADPEQGFLWRIEKEVPRKPGSSQWWNRGPLEDVGVVRVHNFVPESVWRPRYPKIRDFFNRISQPSAAIPGGVHARIYFLHISPEEQLERLNERRKDPTKHWKLSESDFKERHFWPEYMKAYSEAISECSTEEAPILVVPANHKWMSHLIVSQDIVNTLEGLHMKYPEPPVDAKTIGARYFDKKGKLKPEFDVQAAAEQPVPAASSKVVQGNGKKHSHPRP